ncbi:hypothetical protein [Paraburkholderia tropica]|uniref:hypothetical protein n=1 Tax=Paraburkholderia tropica TaxID=92647 RepID=UPI002AB6EFF2|nr:hypothetical protein [Paraburkholderia tropica]
MKLAYPTRCLLRADGTMLDLGSPKSHDEIRTLIGCDCALTDSVMLSDRVHVMIIDDHGDQKELPVNVAATNLYLSRCAPGTRWVIRGNAVIVPDADFAPPALKRFYEEFDDGNQHRTS